MIPLHILWVFNFIVQFTGMVDRDMQLHTYIIYIHVHHHTVQYTAASPPDSPVGLDSLLQSLTAAVPTEQHAVMLKLFT